MFYMRGGSNKGGVGEMKADEGGCMKIAIEIADGEVIGVRGSEEGVLWVIDHDFGAPHVSKHDIQVENIDALLQEVPKWWLEEESLNESH